MKALASERMSVAKAVWLIGVFLIAWPLFLLLPFGAKPVKPPRKLALIPPSGLVAFGLQENVDWVALPELFNVWAGHAEWRNDKAQFAYWHPGDRSYSYFFETIRAGDKFSFRALSRVEALQWKEFVGDSDGVYVATDTGRSQMEIQAVDFSGESPTHPFVFFRQIEPLKFPRLHGFPITGPGPPSATKVPLSGFELSKQPPVVFRNGN